MSRLVDLYAYRTDGEEIKTLILKRSPDVIYAGQWRMVGGKVRDDEKAYEAARRELLEETGWQPQTFWALPSVNQFYDVKSDTIRQIPAFAAEISAEAEPVNLDHEHVDARWIRKEQISDYICWPEQQRLMKLLISITTQNKLLDEWIIPNN
jgi:dATP pyrophosphohydrolase